MSNESETESNKILKLVKNTSKEVLITLVTTLLGGFALTYFITREFITHYIGLIGFQALEQVVITNESTVHSLTWSISVLVFTIIYTLCLAPALLRLLYSKDKHHFERFQTNKPLLSKFILFLIFTAFPLVALLLAYYQWNITLAFMVPILLAIPISCILCSENYERGLTTEQKFVYLGGSLIFTFACTLALFPFYFLLTQIDYSSLLGSYRNDRTLMISLIILWLIYCLVYGIRIMYNSVSQYIIDICIAIYTLILIATFSPITIILPVVEKSGIKDASPQIYKVNESEYKAHIEHHINNYWLLGSSSITNNCDSNKSNCTLLKTTETSNSEPNKLYINLLTVYRDDERHIVCPPNYPIRVVLRKGVLGPERENIVAKCLNVPTSILQPTPLSELSLKADKEYMITNKSP